MNLCILVFFFSSQTFQEANIKSQFRKSLISFNKSFAFLLGNTLGSLEGGLFDRLFFIKLGDKLEEKSHRERVKIYGKEQAEKLKLEWKKLYIEYEAREKRPIKVRMTQKEHDEITSKLIPYITQFRAKISQELALKKS